MKTNTLEVKAAIQISKPVNEVFEAIVDPLQMINYFISKASGPTSLPASRPGWNMALI